MCPITNICLTLSVGCARVGADGRAVAAEEGENAALPSAASSDGRATRRVALTNRIAAGRGLEALATEEANSLAFELLATRSVRRRYLLRVVGQSVVRASIEDSDLLVVEEDEAPPDEAVMVAFCGTGRRWP